MLYIIYEINYELCTTMNMLLQLRTISFLIFAGFSSRMFPLAQLECFNAVVNKRDSSSCTRNVLDTCYKQLKNILYTVSEV